MKRGVILTVLGLCLSLLPAPSRGDGLPPAPSLTAPSGSGTPATPSYSWSAAPGAEDYYLWVNNAAGVPVVQSWHPASSACAASACSVTPTTSLSRGHCTWWVQARNSSGSGPWSAGMGFTVGAPPAAPTTVSPSGAGVPATPTYSWNVVADTAQYSLWVNSGSGAPVTQANIEAAACAGAVCTATPAAALVPGPYTWWLQARNASGDGPWSAGVGFTVGSLPPAASLIGPAGAGASTTPTYTWNAVDGVTEYYVQVNSAAGTPVVQTWLATSSVCVGALCSTTPSAALAPGSHQWWIQTRNASGDGPWSAGMTFTVGELPGAATLVSPTGSGISSRPTLTWRPVAAATHYYVWINGPAGTPVERTWHLAADVCGVDACVAIPSAVLARGAQTWWIQGRNASGDGVWSAGMAFTVGDLPGAPIPRAPAGPVATASPSYVWDPVPDTSDYYLWVNNPGGTPVVQIRYTAEAVCTQDSCSAKPALALGGGGHTWWVQPRNGSGDGPWSAGMSFTVIATGTVAAGGSHSLALTTEGKLWAWGSNWAGQLGLGSVEDAPLPTRVDGVSNLVAVAGGDGHTVALRGDGTVWAAGYNGDGELGQPGGDSAVFVLVPGLTGVVQVASGAAHVLALKADGTVIAWGANWSGQLGDGTFDSAFSPVTVAGVNGVVAVAAGYEHSLALKADGTVLAWGGNWTGALGDGTNDTRPTPAPVSGLSGIVRIASGPAAEHSFAVGADGAVYAWGANWSGQLGDGTTDDRLTPVLVPGLGPVTHIAAGGWHSLAIGQDGSLWSWGGNDSGQLGTEAVGIRTTPAMLASPTGAVAIGAGYQHSLALTSDGRVLSWGDNSGAQLGTGETGEPIATPVELSGPSFQWRTTPPSITPAGGSFTDELDATIRCLMPGATIRYTVDGTEPTEASPAIASGAVVHIAGSTTVQARAWEEGLPPSAVVTAAFTFTKPGPRVNPPAGRYAGRVHVGLAGPTADVHIRYTTDGAEPTLASPLYDGLLTFTQDTTLRARVFPEVGDPSAAATQTYTITAAVGAVGGGADFSLALQPSGAIWAWGAGELGQLGSGWDADNPDPTPVAMIGDAVAIAAGRAHSLAIRANGGLVAWGDNTAGQLGRGAVGGYEGVPVAVPGLDRIVAVAAGGAHSLGLRDDGRVFSWGRNAAGQLGDGSTNDRASPGLVPGLENVVAIAAGEEHSLALAADGRVWAWGGNAWGQVGDGSYAAQSVPVEVFGDAIGIAAGEQDSLASARDRSVWVWGRESSGVPTHLVGSQEGEYCGPMFASGRGATAGSAPRSTQAHSGCIDLPFTDVVDLEGGGTHSMAVRTDERAWTWGGGEDGQLGTGESWGTLPASVEGPQSVVDVAAGSGHSLALAVTGEVWAWGKNTQGQVGDGTTTNRWTPVRVASPGFGWSEPLSLPRPRLVPPPGSYSGAVSVSLTSPVNGAVVRYTTDGTEPSEASPAAEGPVLLQGSTALSAKAFKTGRTPSATASGWYSLHFGTLEPPVASPVSGTYESGVVINLTAAIGAAISFQLCDPSGSANCTDWAPYGSPVSVDRSRLLRSFASRADWTDSAVRTDTYLVFAALPRVDPAGGTYPAGQRITMTSPTPGATLHYTTDGSEPTESVREIASGGSIPAATYTLKVRAFKSGLEPSAAITETYSLSGALTSPELAAGESHSVALRSDGSVWAWGANSFGMIGEVGPEAGRGPTRVSALAGVTQVSSTAYHSLALTGDRYVWAWGANWEGQLGDGTSSTPGTPVLVTALQDATAVAAGGRHSLALRSDGTVRAWGSNFAGQLGDGTAVNRSVPVEVLGLEGVVSIAAGGYHSLALRADGTVLAWGYNGRGQLGDGGTTSRATPEAVPGLADITAVSAGPQHSLALRSDGTVWAWGASDYDHLAYGVPGTWTAPTPIPGLTGVVAIAAGGSEDYYNRLPVSYSLALTADGSLWAWGGELGAGWAQGWRSTPGLVSLPPVTGLAAGASHVLAFSDDGRVWAWGANAQRQIGDWTTTERPRPIQIAAPALEWLVAEPVLSQPGGTYPDAFSVSLTSATPGASIHFTLDGTEPTEASPEFASPVSVDGSLTLKTRAYRADLAPSLLASTVYVLKVPAPQLSPAGGAFRRTTWVRIGCEGLAAESVHYRLDGRDPDEADPQIACELGLRISAPTTLTVKAWRAGWEPSDTATGTFVFTAPPSLDSDGDGLPDSEEASLGSDPDNPDTNGDGLPDGAAHAAGLSVTDMDMDDDTLPNLQERIAGTDPFRGDTDGDGVPDAADCFPLDRMRSACLPADPEDHLPPAIALAEPASAVLVIATP